MQQSYFSFNKKNSYFKLYKSTRIFIYIILYLSIININISGSLFPYSSEKIKSTFFINEIKFSYFTLFTAIGKVFGSIIFLQVLNSTNRKIFLFLSLFSKSLFLFVFNYTYDFYLLLTLKFFIGLCNMFINIYTPVWIEHFIVKKSKKILNSLIQLANPLGKVLGLILNYFFDWKTVLKIESMFIFIYSIIILFFSNNYFSANVEILINKDSGEEIFNKREENLIKNDNNEINIQQESLIKKSIILFHNKIFVLSLLIRTFLLSIQFNILFWIPDYFNFQYNLEEKNKKLRLIYNILIILCLPIGAFLSGIIISFTLIGYTKKRNSSFYMIIFYIMSFIFSIFIPIQKKSKNFTILIIIYSIFSSACLPMFQGLCMTSVSPTLKGDAFTIAHIFSLLYSNGIAPVLFGLFYNNNKYKKLSLFLLFEIYLGIGAILLPILIYLVVKKNKAALPGNRTTAFRYELKKKRERSNSNAEEVVQELGNAYAENLPNIIKEKENNDKLNESSISGINLNELK